jgi:hypothetical protein
MIRFTLTCDAPHRFESWFRDNASFDGQVARGLVECPVCGSAKIGKAIMAPHVARTDRGLAAIAAETAVDPAPGRALAPAAATGSHDITNQPLTDKALRDLVRAWRQHVLEATDPVGDRFADEALKMHHGEIEHRPIHGSATIEDARMLIEEGVGFQPLPILPDDRN